MKNLYLVILTVILTSLVSCINVPGKKVSDSPVIENGVLVFKKDIPGFYNGHIVTYRGLYNGGLSYQINFDNNRSTLTTSATKVNSIVDSVPPFFVDFEVEYYDDSEIRLRFTRFETPACYNSNIKLKPMR